MFTARIDSFSETGLMIISFTDEMMIPDLNIYPMDD